MNEYENRRERTAKRPKSNVSAVERHIVTERAAASQMWGPYEVGFLYADLDDPDGICPDPSSKYYDYVKGKVWFARALGSNNWVSFRDLEPWLRLKLWEKALREKDEASFLKGIPIEELIKMRAEEALKIDPETAEVIPGIVDLGDEHGLERETNKDYVPNFAMAQFVRRPGGNIWLYIGDLPRPVQYRLGERANNGEFEDIGRFSTVEVEY